MQAGKIRLVVVTRSDASAGLHSVRLADQTESVTIGRLGTEWLSQWFAQVTADDGKGEVIAKRYLPQKRLAPVGEELRDVRCPSTPA